MAMLRGPFSGAGPARRRNPKSCGALGRGAGGRRGAIGPLWVLLVLGGACETEGGDDPPTLYQLAVESDPAPPSAGQEAVLDIAISDEDGEPIPDLQVSHDRIVHVLALSHDHRHFAHLHHEDHAVVGAEELRSSRFQVRWDVPAAGPFGVVVDFAHRGLYLQRRASLDAVGNPEQEPVVWTFPTEAADRDVVASLSWEAPPFAGSTARGSLELRTTAGDPVEDLVPWLAADGHAVYASADLGFVGHTHAWVEGMEDAPPGHVMPHTYDGPVLPFHIEFPDLGPWTLWMQVAREAEPDRPYVFRFEVAVEG